MIRPSAKLTLLKFGFFDGFSIPSPSMYLAL